MLQEDRKILMKTDEAKSILEIVRGASAGDIAVVSFIFLPILLAAWSVLLNSVGALPMSSTNRMWLVLALIAIYAATVLIMKRTESTQNHRIRAVKHIRNKLQCRPAPNQDLASFDYIRKRVNSAYTDDFLLKLVDDFPDDFMRIKCKGDKPGLKLIDDEVA
jgi:hypothetical protein